MEKQPYAHQPWPSWRYGPDGASAVFETEQDVPAGWADHPDKVGTKPVKAAPAAPASTPAAAPASTPATASTSDEAPKVDAEGTPFNADMHTGTLTKAGLWRMKVGVSRPPAAAKPALEL
jgi:hypothetical protein